MANKSYKTAIGINSTPEIFNSFCSCQDCDTGSCFTHRREQSQCACSNCKPSSQACLFFTNKSVELDDTQSRDFNDDNIPEKQQFEAERFYESLTKDITHDNGRQINAEESIMKDISKYLNKTGEETKNSIEKRRDSKRSPRVRSMSLTYSRQDINPGAAKLSAQVMNVPYKDFKESISYNQAEPHQCPLTKYDIFKRIKEAYDACSCKVCECIGTKSLPVKNELCKFKPCECQDCSSYLAKMEFPGRRKLSQHKCAKLGGKGLLKIPTEPGVCDCKPCDCIKCTESFSKPCNCEPCQCIECKHFSIHQPRPLVVAPVGEDLNRNECFCAPCDCVQCGHFGIPSHLMHEMSTGINRHPNCHCEACADNTCEPDGTETCKCERQRKVMRKPIERDSHDYDIRRVTVSDSPQQPEDKNKTKHNTIAMFAAMASTFPRFQQAYKQMTMSKIKAKHECKCEECECIVCDCKETSSKIVAQPKPRQSLRIQPTTKAASCSCTPCECLVCSSYKEDTINTFENSVDCKCDICYCLNCKSAKMSKTNDHHHSKMASKFSSKACNCNQCDCPDCQNIKSEWDRSGCDCLVNKCKHCSFKYVASNESLYPIKKGERLTPSIYNTKVNNSLETLSKRGKGGFTYCSSKKSKSKMRMPGDLSIYQTCSQCDYIDRYLHRQPINLMAETQCKKQIKNPNHLCNQSSNLKGLRMGTSNDILKCEAYTQYDNSYKSMNKIVPSDYEAPGSCHSEYFSYESTPKTSDTKENSITPVSGTRNKSWESSCNSSGHDNPDYLVSFPKSAEVGVRLAMQLNMDKDLNLERLNNALKKINTCSGNKTVSLIDEINRKLNIGVKKECGINNDCNCKSLGLKATSNNHNIDLVKQIKSGNASINYFNSTTQSLYPVPKVSYEPIAKPEAKTLRSSLPIFETTYCEKKNIRTKYDSYDFRKQNKQLQERINHKAAIEIGYMDDDYQRVQNTLNEAKAFSFQLIQILEKYEKANREFVSISQKLKKSHESILNKNNTEDVDLLKMDKGDGQTGIQSPDPYAVPERERTLAVTDNLIVTGSEVTNERQLVHERPQDMEYNASDKADNEVAQIVKTNYEDNNENVLEFARNVNKNTKIEQIFQSKDDDIKQTQDFNYNSSKTSIVECLKTCSRTNRENHKMTDNVSSKYLMSPRCSQHNFAPEADERTIRKRYKKYSRLLRRTINVSKKVNLKCVVEPKLVTKVCVSTEISNTLISQADKEVTSEIGNLLQLEAKEIEEINNIAKRLNVVFGSAEEISASTSADDTAENINKNNCEDTTKTDDMSLTVLKKNLSINTEPCTKNKGVCIFPSLEVELKEAVHSISLQTCAIRGTRQNLNYENKALVELQVEVNKLLNIPLLSLDTDMDLPPFVSAKSSPESPFQAKLDLEDEDPMIMKSSQTYNFKKELVDENINCSRQPCAKGVLKRPNCASLKDAPHVQVGLINVNGESNDAVLNCSCEALKVADLGVRKVSDHTVLVKWNAPRSTHDVNGYELLVDGRPVQTILGPTRCMAVVTCLPHSDKVLITIRTITVNPTHETTHIPSTTVVYRRRAK